MDYLQIVPGYYVRRDIKGQIENSAAMNNTASEHFMVDRLIVDDLLNWAVNYKVSGQWYQYSNYWYYIMIIPVISDLMAHPRYAQKNSCIHGRVLLLPFPSSLDNFMLFTCHSFSSCFLTSM
jgi:hypothetical protein